MEKLYVTGWGEMQHYKERLPPWIKFPTDYFQRYEFASLTDQAKLLLFACWALAAKTHEGYIPADFNYIKKISLLGDWVQKEHLQELVNAGLLNDASSVLADCYQVATPEREREAETETEGETERENQTQKIKTEKKAKKDAAPSTRLTDYLAETSNGLPPAEWGEYAHNTFGWDAERISFEWDDFHDYWTSGNAKGGGRKSDWAATWRSHCRRNAAQRNRGYRAGQTANRGIAAVFREVVARKYGAVQPRGSFGGGQSANDAGTDARGTPERLPVGEIAF